MRVLVGLAVVLGLKVVLGFNVVLGLKVVLGFNVVLGLGGIGGLLGRGGPVPSFVGVSTTLPSQYIVFPFRESSFRIVLMPSVPGPRQLVELACRTSRGVGYSMWKTGLFIARKRP